MNDINDNNYEEIIGQVCNILECCRHHLVEKGHTLNARDYIAKTLDAVVRNLDIGLGYREF